MIHFIVPFFRKGCVLPRKTDSGNPQDWLEYAKIDLDAVRVLCDEQVAFSVCKSKLAEALEKSIKADLLAHGWLLVKIHDLQKLNDYLSVYDEEVAERLQSTVDDLAESYIIDRYPGFDLEDPDWDNIKKLLVEVSQYVEQMIIGG